MTIDSGDSSLSPLKSLGGIKRRAVSVTTEALVKTGPLFPDGDLPLLVEPAVQGLNLATWAAANRALLDEKLLRHGGILFRGFNVQEPEELEKAIQAISGESLEYRERSSPRTAVSGNIYTSTDYPPSYPIFLHNENSYQSQWPLKIFFLCRQPPQEGGATPIADCPAGAPARIDPEIRERFASAGVDVCPQFRRRLRPLLAGRVPDHRQGGGGGATAGTTDRDGMEGRRPPAHAAVRPALVRHPKTGEPVWFNHATFFHVSTLEPASGTRCSRSSTTSELPTNTYYGDGSPIEPEVMDHLRAAYRRETVSFPWQKGDLLMLDNMLVAHGRAPFSGPRQMLVGMAEAVAREQVLIESPGSAE